MWLPADQEQKGLAFPGMIKTKTAYGIDLAGYRGGRTGFARAQRSKSGILVTVYRNTPLSRKLKGESLIEPTLTAELEFLGRCLQTGVLVVDIPIDLQQLAPSRIVKYVWELTQRPVDRAFSGLRPLADRIGSPVARFRHLLSRLPNALPPLAGRRIYESYPAASLQVLGIPHSGYKGSISMQQNGWGGAEPLCIVAKSLCLAADCGEKLSDDQMDAIICALAGVSTDRELLHGDDLRARIRATLTEKMGVADVDARSFEPPEAYMLLRSPPTSNIRVTVRDYNGNFDR